MAKLNKHTKCTAVIVALLILFAMFLRIMSQHLPPNNLRGLIYFGLFSTWGVSVRRRILQVQVRRYLTAISVLMVFWVVVRSLKFMMFADTHLGRYCWYLYYFPMLFIPLLVLLVALSLGKPEDFRLPKWANGLLLVSAALLVLVLTNDLHQLAFTFPKGLLFFDNNDYTHELVYFLSMGWMALCAVSAIAVMIMKCHIPSNKKRIYLPYIPLLALLLYAVLYLTAWDLIKPFAGDMTVVCCLLITATLESCIQCHLIQSNTGYDELFRAAGIRAKISDKDYNILLSSTDADTMPAEVMQQTEAAPVLLDGGIRLCGAPIKGGHVLWSEDVSELLQVLSELRDAKDELEDDNNILSAEYELEARKAHIEEQDRLYNIIQRQTARQIDLLVRLTDELEQTEAEEARRALLGKMVVIGAYLKRRNNLIFMSDKSPLLDAKELALTFGESLDNLELYGVKCGFHCQLTGPVAAERMMIMYDLFEQVVERSLDTMSALTVSVAADGSMTLNTDSGAPLSELSSERVTVLRDEDGEWQLRLEFGGESI